MSAVAETVQEETGKAKTVVEQVTMEDGRSVTFSGKRKLLKESTIDDSGITTRLDFRNGRTISFVLPSALVAQFAAHGAEQKLGDETAGTEDVEDMILDIEALIARLEKGEWTTKREGGGMSGTSVLLRALVELSGKTPEQIKLFLQGDPTSSDPEKQRAKTNAEKMALRNSPQLKPIVERLESEKSAKAAKVDTGALLASLD